MFLLDNEYERCIHETDEKIDEFLSIFELVQKQCKLCKKEGIEGFLFFCPVCGRLVSKQFCNHDIRSIQDL